MGAKAKSSKARRRKPEPTIIRAPHDRKNPYVQIRRSSLEDDELSWEARGLLAYLLAKPDDWQIQISDLVNSGSAGRDKVYRMMGELEVAGYLRRVRTRAEDHTFTGIRYHLYESPHTDLPDTENQEVDPLPENPDTDLPDTAEPDTANPTHTKEEVNTNKENSTKEEGTNDLPADAGRTLTPQQEYFQKICDIVGWDYKTLTKNDQGRIAQTMGILQKADYTLDDLCRFSRDVWAHDWRWQKNGQHPTLNQLRQEIGKLRTANEIPRDATRRQSESSAAVDRVVARLKEQQSHEQY